MGSIHPAVSEICVPQSLAPICAKFDKFLAHGQAQVGQMGKWPWRCTTTGLDNSTELRMEKIHQAVTEIWVPQVWQPPAHPDRDSSSVTLMCLVFVVVYQYRMILVIKWWRHQMETFSALLAINGNIFRVTGHLCEEFTGHRWIPHYIKITWDSYFQRRYIDTYGKWGFKIVMKYTEDIQMWKHGQYYTTRQGISDNTDGIFL